MIQYKFIINKEICFAYWAQLLIQWGWYFEKRGHEFYKKYSEPFSLQEESALKMLKTILEKENNYFLWLWKQYTGKPIENVDELDRWNKIKKSLLPKFEAVWKDELPLLERWQKKLENYSFQPLESAINLVACFFDAPSISDEEIIVKLSFCHDTETPTAHVKREFPSVMILNISRVDFSNLNKTISTILHETIHLLMEYKSSRAESLLHNSYSTIIVPLAIQLKNYKWKHLFVESVISSIASSRLNSYFGRIIEKDEKAIASDVVGDFNLEKQKTNYGFLIRVIAERIEPLTTSYLMANKVIDRTYADLVVNEWATLLK